jgi:hypothetical protein
MDAGMMNLSVQVVNNGVMGPDGWTDLAMQQIMGIAESAPSPIRQQAEAFSAQIRWVICHYIGHAVDERRSRDALLAENSGQNAIAAMIRGDL